MSSHQLPKPDLNFEDHSELPQTTVTHLSLSQGDTDPGSILRLSPQQVANLLTQPQQHGFDAVCVIDCRYGYEYDAGHIKGALNVQTEKGILDLYQKVKQVAARTCFVFHCEYSQNRGPSMMYKFRGIDRNYHKYPELACPSLCLLVGGYRPFFAHFPDMCDGGYVEMRDPEHLTNGDLRTAYLNAANAVITEDQLKPVQGGISQVLIPFMTLNFH